MDAFYSLTLFKLANPTPLSLLYSEHHPKETPTGLGLPKGASTFDRSCVGWEGGQMERVNLGVYLVSYRLLMPPFTSPPPLSLKRLESRDADVILQTPLWGMGDQTFRGENDRGTTFVPEHLWLSFNLSSDRSRHRRQQVEANDSKSISADIWSPISGGNPLRLPSSFRPLSALEEKCRSRRPCEQPLPPNDSFASPWLFPTLHLDAEPRSFPCSPPPVPIQHPLTPQQRMPPRDR